MMSNHVDAVTFSANVLVMSWISSFAWPRARDCCGAGARTRRVKTTPPGGGPGGVRGRECAGERRTNPLPSRHARYAESVGGVTAAAAIVPSAPLESAAPTRPAADRRQAEAREHRRRRQ